MALYAQEGPRFVRRLRGGFGVCPLGPAPTGTPSRRRSFRDQTPVLCTDASNQTTAFASIPSALVRLCGGQARVDPTGVYNYMNFGYIPAPTSIFKGVSRLAPGHMLRVRDGKATPEPYWTWNIPRRLIQRGDAARTVFRLTKDAISRTLYEMPPKEVGAFLSGGTDSSTVVGLMTRLTDGPVRAFSIGFHEETVRRIALCQGSRAPLRGDTTRKSSLPKTRWT